MIGFICGVLAGIVVMNVGILWLGYLVSDQRPVRIEVDPRFEIASSAAHHTALPFTEA